MLFFAYLTWALVAGPDLVTNPVFGTFYVLVWVGLVPASLLFGPVVRAVSPLRTLATLLGRSGGGTVPLSRAPGGVAGCGGSSRSWPKLVNPRSPYLDSVRLWLAGYVEVMLVGAVVFGERWFARADPFEVYSTLAAHLSVWGGRQGVLVVRSPIAGLDLVDTAALTLFCVLVAASFTVAAHDRALRLWPPRHRLAGKLGLLAVMVCYTAGGLYLLFGS